MKMAILGAGKIAELMATTIAKMEQVESYAVGSRDLNRAKEFANKFHFRKAYGSYEEMLQDEDIDLVYIAVPHSHHYDTIKLCLEHGKNVLCEKAFTVNATQAKEVLAMAKEKHLLLTEAIWTRYNPMRKVLDDIIDSGMIGKVHSVTANLCYVLNYLERNKKPELAGGALLDLGVYPLNFACMVLKGEIKDIKASAIMNEYGVDDSNSMLLTFDDGTTATLHSSQLVSSERGGYVYGTEGYVVIENINNVQGYRVYNRDHQLIKEYKTPDQITGYEYEVEACRVALENGWLECPDMPHAETIRMMETMDKIRGIWGLKYPME